MSIPLLPCPFCGYEAEIERLGDGRRSTIYACTSCSCSLETGEEWDHGRDWNRRAAVSPLSALESQDIALIRDALEVYKMNCLLLYQRAKTQRERELYMVSREAADALREKLKDG